MVEISTISAALGSIKTAAEIARLIKDTGASLEQAEIKPRSDEERIESYDFSNSKNKNNAENAIDVINRISKLFFLFIPLTRWNVANSVRISQYSAAIYPAGRRLVDSLQMAGALSVFTLWFQTFHGIWHEKKTGNWQKLLLSVCAG